MTDSPEVQKPAVGEYPTTLAQCVSEFQLAFAAGTDAIIKACRAYVYALDTFDEAKQGFMKACPTIPQRVWTSIEAVGREWIDPRLLWGGGNATKYLRKLPLSTQRETLSHGVDVATDAEVVHVACEAVPSAMLSQVFAPDHIRTPAEQRAFRSRHPDPITPAAQSKSWEVKKHQLRVYRPTVFSTKEVQQILKVMA